MGTGSVRRLCRVAEGDDQVIAGFVSREEVVNMLLELRSVSLNLTVEEDVEYMINEIDNKLKEI